MAGVGVIPGGVADTGLDGHRMWTPTTRAQRRRDHLRYASDLTEAEWAVLEPLFPAARAHRSAPHAAAPRAGGDPLVKRHQETGPSAFSVQPGCAGEQP
jgi:hypothetical protein